MTLRKITIDNSVRYISTTEQIKEKNNKPKTIKAASLPRKKTKTFHKIVKNLLMILQLVDLEYLQISIHTSIKISVIIQY